MNGYLRNNGRGMGATDFTGRVLALLAGVTMAAGAAESWIFIGTHTGGQSEARGIYRAAFDTETGALGPSELVAGHESPGFLALHPTLRVMYSIGRARGDLGDDGPDAVAAFGIAADGGLEFLGEAPAGGRGVCHLAVDAAGTTVAVANYGDGSFATVRLDDRGIPDALVSRIRVTGSGPNEARQRGAHAHGVYFDHGNRHLLVPDLGTDRVHLRRFDPATSELGEALGPLVCAPGAGPRHLAFSPCNRHVYVINELDSTLQVAAYDADSGAFDPVEAVATLPADYDGGNTTAEVEVHGGGMFVYASNRGHDSLAVFRRDPADGTLELIERVPSGGGHPRHFKIDPSGRWLLCANRDANNIVVFAIDQETGRLTATGDPLVTPSPICVLFVGRQ